MKLIYYKSDIGNFGDDLNPWIWNKLLGNIDDYDAEIDFVGIGSILDERINGDRKKVVFGSGVRDFNFRIEDILDLDIRFVRGPISSKALNNCKYLTDGAYGLRLLPKQSFEKKYDVSFIPYFRHVNHFNWLRFQKITGIHVILPTMHVEEVIKEINQSKKILTAAMHGAILGDIYRVPWMRVKFSQHGLESGLTSELKWNDWLLSLGINKAPIHIFDFHFNTKSKTLKQLYYILRMKSRFKKSRFIMSSNDVIKEIDKKFRVEIDQFKKDYKRS